MVELMIVVAIVAILAAIALPSYQAQIAKSRRAEGRASLLQAASQMERYFTERSTYATATLGTGGVYPDHTEHSYYALSVAKTASTFILSAVPSGIHAGDPCGTLTYTEQGVKGYTGSADASLCW